MEASGSDKVFRVFEHSSYNTRNPGREGKVLPEELFAALKDFAGDRDLPWYSLTANGVRFHQYVGAIQIGKYCVEILPKIDRGLQNEEPAQSVLINMLKQCGYFSVNTPTESDLKLRNNFILEVYIKMFLDEVRDLMHRGLVKHYYKTEGNNNYLKGSLLFNKHIHRNLIHAERFYSRHTIYDRDHFLNRILRKTLKVITRLPVSSEATGTARNLLSLFPELGDIEVNDDLFDKIRYHRKTEAYRKSVEASRLLLLNYHPDLSHGRNNVLAIMFDMNDLWETWFTKRLIIATRDYPDISVRPQYRKVFWTSTESVIRQKPDIIIEIDSQPGYIIDTKWKIISGRPSEEDVRQMFAYNKLFNTRKSWLVYPGESASVTGRFYESENNGECSLASIMFHRDGRLCDAGIREFASKLLSMQMI